jgi:membrane associated rhomboid family serine protease
MNDRGGPLATAGRNLRRIVASHASMALALGIIAIHLALQSSTNQRGWYETFGLSRDGMLGGKVWQIFTHALLHGAWWHAILNALFVLAVGSRIEHVAGGRAMLRVTLAGILFGGAFHLLLGAGLLVGLSGGCMALLLLLTTLSPQSRMLPLPISGRSLGLGILLSSLMLALVNPDLRLPVFQDAGRWLIRRGFGSWFQMGHACHFGGALAGWLCGRWMLRPRVTLDRLRRDRARREMP